MKQAGKKFGPKDLRIVLVASQILILIIGALGFYWGLGVIRSYSIEMNQQLVDAEASGKQVEQLQALKSYLTQSASLVEKANLLFTTPNNYQSQVLSDVKNYATRAGLTITSTRFTDASQGVTTGTYSMEVNFKQPVSYTKLITFLNGVEGNLPKLQISSISLSRGIAGADSVTVGKITIDVAVR